MASTVRPLVCLSTRGGFRSILISHFQQQLLWRPNLAAASFHSAHVRHMQSSGWASVNTTSGRRKRGTSTIDQAIQENIKEIPEERTADVDKTIQDNIADIRRGDFKSVTDPEKLSHFRTGAEEPKTAVGEDGKPIMGAVAMPHPIWTEDEVSNVAITHKEPEGFIDKFAFYGVKSTRAFFDTISGFNRKRRDERVWLTRLCFLETVAAVPGMVAAMVRHLTSLRRMSRDHGWIHTLLEEAENERMHLMTFLLLKQPSIPFRMMVMLTQGVFVTGFSVAYLLSPKLCHRFVGYLEEEAVVTYTKLLKDIDHGTMTHWLREPASKVAIHYWNLGDHATMRDVILAIRADEAHHRVVNHTLGSLKKTDYNPYKPGE